MRNHALTASADAKAQRLHAFRGHLAEHDAETVAHWRAASPAQHAAAMIELSDCAEQIAATTGLGKDPTEMFPGFPPPRAGGTS